MTLKDDYFDDAVISQLDSLNHIKGMSKDIYVYGAQTMEKSGKANYAKVMWPQIRRTTLKY